MIKIRTFIARGRKANEAGAASDGCTLVGFIVHRFWPDVKECCIAHDMAVRGLVDGVNTDNESDYMLRECVRSKGHSILGWVMYAAVRVRTWTGLPPNVFFGGLMFLLTGSGVYYFLG